MELVIARQADGARVCTTNWRQQGVDNEGDMVCAQKLTRRHLQLRESGNSSHCSEDSADIYEGPQAQSLTEEAGSRLEMYSTPHQIHTASSDSEIALASQEGSCDLSVWQQLRFTKGSKWTDDFSDSESLADCAVSTSLSHSPCTTCAGDEETCEGVDSEADAADESEPEEEDEVEPTVRSLSDLRAELSCYAFRSTDLGVAEHFIRLLSDDERIADRVLTRSFYLAVLGSMRVLHLHDVDMMDILATLAYAGVYLKGDSNLSIMPQRDMVYRTVLTISLAFSYVSDDHVPVKAWKKYLEKTVDVVAKSTAAEMSTDIMDIFRKRNYVLRVADEELTKAEEMLRSHS
eukprot:TRINITY_DN31440_c0_g1_i1.p1 TRINITY_DN31440_c0_g1~~TRINITY_DN31440_c0_g1_i1.p1  ORF type:complete len:347 (-),score=67.94 TRINITY_DN31440_c0_g1_i1:576-1616(-)